jgi:ligand-binding sensor domain-containing protein
VAGFQRQYKLAFPLLLALTLGALTYVRAERLPIKSYTTADGLAHNNIHRIVPDSRGFLWFCTFGGLSRFDGYSFTSYSVDQGLPSPVVNDLLETREGDYWVATGAGLCRLNTIGGAGRRSANGAIFTVYYPGEDAASKEVLSLLQSRDGRLWCGTAAGLYQLEVRDGRESFRRVELGMRHDYERERQINSIIEDRKGSLWIGSLGGIYRLLPDGRAESYSWRHNDQHTGGVHCMLEDREGRIWVGTRMGGLVRLVSDPVPSRPVVERIYTDKDGLPSKWINQIYQSSDGTLWAASSNGLVRFLPIADGKEFRFRSYSADHGLTYQEVQSLAEDRNGNLWVGMLIGGVAKLSRNGITAFTEADGFKWASLLYKDRGGALLVAGGPATPSTLSTGWKRSILRHCASSSRKAFYMAGAGIKYYSKITRASGGWPLPTVCADFLK